jgi:hypothetical protein
LIVDAYSDGDFSVAKLTGARKITDIWSETTASFIPSNGGIKD